MNNQQPSGEAQSQNSALKPWYKKWWGIVIAILFLPIFAIWWVWKKTSWSQNKKVLATIGIVILSIIVYSSDDEATPNTQEAASGTSETQQPASTPEPAIQPIFDIPALVGKNVDEVKAALGKPEQEDKPTQQQISLGINTGDLGYTKDGLGLLVNYDVTSKEALEFFLEGEDKAKLLAQGNLQEKSDTYVVEAVQVLNNPSEITGIKVMKKLPQELDANVTYNAIAFKIDNKENYNWTNCTFKINGKVFSGGYEYKATSGIKANDSLLIPFSEFTKDSKRFDFFSEKPENLFISCDALEQHRSNYFGIN